MLFDYEKIKLKDRFLCPFIGIGEVVEKSNKQLTLFFEKPFTSNLLWNTSRLESKGYPNTNSYRYFYKSESYRPVENVGILIPEKFLNSTIHTITVGKNKYLLKSEKSIHNISDYYLQDIYTNGKNKINIKTRTYSDRINDAPGIKDVSIFDWLPSETKNLKISNRTEAVQLFKNFEFLKANFPKRFPCYLDMTNNKILYSVDNFIDFEKFYETNSIKTRTSKDMLEELIDYKINKKGIITIMTAKFVDNSIVKSSTLSKNFNTYAALKECLEKYSKRG